MKSGIYKITNIDNGKFYIGSSKDVDWRWYCHKHYLENGCHINPKLQHSWNKHGENKFIFEIIEEVKPDEKLLLEREQHHLDLLKPHERNVGYNICPTAEGGDNITYNPNRGVFIEKMKIITKGQGNGMFGKKHTKKSIQLQKEKSVGRYTLDWFVERYGKRKGKRMFKDRNTMLKNRQINYSYDNKLSGKKRGPMSDEIKKRISERKAHLKLIRNDLRRDILSNIFTIPQLESKYGTSKTTILREKRKLA